MNGPSRRDVERALQRIEDGNEDGLGADHRTGDVKLYPGGIDFDAFDLSEEARERIEQASQPGTEAPVVAYDDASAFADDTEAACLPDATREEGWDAGELLERARAAEEE